MGNFEYEVNYTVYFVVHQLRTELHMYSTKMGSNVKIIVFVLPTISMYGGLFFAVWNLHTQSIAQSVSLKSDNRNQITELHSLNVNQKNQISELQTLKSANENLQKQISEMQTLKSAHANHLNCEALSELILTPHSSDEATVVDTIK